MISELAKELLGPSGGPNETLDEGPRQRYVTGVLAPTKEIPDDPTFRAPISPVPKSNEDLTISVDGELSPPLRPDKIPSTMGISFIAESEEPKFSVCVTWARYKPSGFDQHGKATGWIRNPRDPFIKTIGLTDKTPIPIIHNNITELELHHSISSMKQAAGSKKSSMIHLRIKNSIDFKVDSEGKPEDLNPQKFFIFQPEIRVVCEEGTKLKPGFDPKFTEDKSKYMSEVEEKETLEILYRKRRIFAKGHLVSAVWNDPDTKQSMTDPQVDKPDTSRLTVPSAADEIPFVWTDGANVSDKRFKRPDVRTEFLPLYSIPKPDLFWNDINKKQDGSNYCDKKPELKAEVLADTWDDSDISSRLEPLCEGYQRWIQETKNILEGDPDLQSDDDKDIVKNILKKCENVLKKMEKGIKLLKTDKKARLAFCFANKAVNMQSEWKNQRKFEYYPFQLAFILSTIESIAKSDSDDREVCDLLWVPTGGGKTEAYLVLTAFLIAYRRRREIEKGKTGDGVAVLTRYTLRLLSVQQFRRMLSIIMACEKLRVDRTTSKIGWRPQGSGNTDNIIWGSTPFSLGLWLGDAMTPNHLRSTGWNNTRRHQALEHLMETQKMDRNGRATSEWSRNKAAGGGDPCQVSNCPACKTTLSISSSEENPGLESEREKVIFLTLKADGNDVPSLRTGLTFQNTSWNMTVNNTTPAGTGYTVFEISVTAQYRNKTGKEFHDEIVSRIHDTLGIPNTANGSKTARKRIASATADRPGYFMRYRIKNSGDPEHYDFEIICPNPKCPLAEEWFSGAPHGCIHGRQAVASNISNADGTLTLLDRNNLTDVQQAFATSTHISQRITIGAYTVDDQIYAKTPSVVIATVDKFARPPFGRATSDGTKRSNSAAAIFGNVTGHHLVHGYYRIDAGLGEDPSPAGGHSHDNCIMVDYLHPPELVIQDELHLIEGPVGSMVGLYETAFDYLCSEHPDVPKRPKYIASTATVRRAEEQVRCAFDRSLSMFPPHGESYGNRFFVKEREQHALDSQMSNGSDRPGKLYMGVIAPGRGAHTPAIRMWSRNATTVWNQKDNLRDITIDKFWTQTGYFNATKELSSFSATYSQDIAQRIRQIGGANHRDLLEDNKLEMSARGTGENGSTSATMPVMLDRLETRYRRDAQKTPPYNVDGSPDSLMGTAMIGTGLDVPRINLMTVFGQPKTMSSYIQATGRSGREEAALVVTFYQAAKPRDLSHYEHFMGHHRQIQRFVEAPTVYPFSVKNMESNMGPVMVYMLRNKIKKQDGNFVRTYHVDNTTLDEPVRWARDDTAIEMGRNGPSGTSHHQDSDVTELFDVIEKRAQAQHGVRKPPTYAALADESAYGIAESEIHKWNQDAQRCEANGWTLDYVEYVPTPNDWHCVVLGDVKHQTEATRTGRTQPGEIIIVYPNAPQSLRDVEVETHVKTSEKSQGVRTSQFIIGMGPGHIFQPKGGVSRVIPDPDIGIFSTTWFQNFPNVLEDDLRIDDAKVSATLTSLQEIADPVKAAMYRIPTNDELKEYQSDRESNDVIYDAKPFPQFYVCTNKVAHIVPIGRNGRSGDYDLMFKNDTRADSPQCPICQGQRNAAVSSTRFLLSCQNGHMDDIDWNAEIHKTHENDSNPRCTPPTPELPAARAPRFNHDTFAIRFNPPNKSGMEAMILYCPRCNREKAMSLIYSNQKRSCTERHPQKEAITTLGGRTPPTILQPCNQLMHVTQKSASFLRSPEITTMLSVGENTTPTDDLFLSDLKVKAACDNWEWNDGNQREINAGNLETFLKNSLGPRPAGAPGEGLLSAEKIFNLLNDRQATLRAIANRKKVLPSDLDELFIEEFHQFLKGTGPEGAPSTAGPRGETPRFRMVSSDCNRNVGNGRYKLRNEKTGNETPKILLAAAVNNLTTITIQTGFKRQQNEEGRRNNQPAENVEIGFQKGNDLWYPAVEFQGEGIFLRFVEEAENENTDWNDMSWTQPLQGERAEKWRTDALANGQHYEKYAFRNHSEKQHHTSRMYELDPDFVWWHSFAHALVKTIQDSAGYSNAAIKERVYFERNDDGRVRGGILLYVSQPGVDGTMGGMIGLIGELDRFVDGAIDMLETCSGDPMCNPKNGGLEPSDTPFGGAACFGCLMNSETSCDIRNFYLDREVFRENKLVKR
tara:strand:+ start:803 stop:7261 length:6459 start_codon:yes stop_codon:yes gene_type:complete